MSGAPDERDCSWVQVQLPLPATAAREFLQDLPRLYRLNPFLELTRAERDAGGVRLAGRNEATGQALDLRVRIAENAPLRLVLRYDMGIKRESRFEIEPSGPACVLAITETYEPVSEDRREQRLKELDSSLVPWAAALRRHLLLRRRWGRVPGYLALLDRWWLTMTPRHRRIGWLLTWTTALEFAVFLAVMAVWRVAG